jgi:hypothetical protein
MDTSHDQGLGPRAAMPPASRLLRIDDAMVFETQA